MSLYQHAFFLPELHVHASVTRRLLQDLVVLMERFSLRQSPSSALHAVQVLSQLTRHDPESFTGNFQAKYLLAL